VLEEISELTSKSKMIKTVLKETRKSTSILNEIFAGL
jgi:hypothetical protein